MTQRLLPPASGPFQILANGRSYSVSGAGVTIDVADADAFVMAANGWTIVANAGAGTTAARPSNPKKTQSYLDTTLGKNIVFDGSAWRDPSTGSAV